MFRGWRRQGAPASMQKQKPQGGKTGKRKTHPIIRNPLAERRFEHSPFDLVVKGGHMKTMLPIHIDEQASNKERSFAGSLAIRSAAPLGTPTGWKGSLPLTDKRP